MNPKSQHADFPDGSVTVRDYIAIEAMKSYIEIHNWISIEKVKLGLEPDVVDHAVISQESYVMADALIAESNKK